MDIDHTQYDAISLKAVSVLGPDVIGEMSQQQLALLDRALDRLLVRHNGSADSVTAAEIEGQYEQIVCHVLPTGSYEHLLRSGE